MRPGQQRSGLGGQLTEAAIAWLRCRSAGAVLLLATDAGRPIYERIGFVAGERYGSFAWPAAPSDTNVVTRPMQAADLPAAYALDHVATGEDRRGFIEAFASSAGWRRAAPTSSAFISRAHGAVVRPSLATRPRA